MKRKCERHVRVSVLLPESLVMDLDRAAALEGRHRSGQLRFLLSEAMALRAAATQKG